MGGGWSAGKHDQFHQDSKMVSRVGESTHDIVRQSTTFLRSEKPEIEFETRQGQFEYVFMYVDFIKTSEDNNIPTRSPVIKSLRYFVENRENRFSRELDMFDLENMNRRNCHEISDFRTLHESGRGILLSLADLGLTESVEFGFKYRMLIRFEVDTVDPESETGPYGVTTDFIADSTRRFTVALLRHNRLLSGDALGTRFEYLNEK